MTNYVFQGKEWPHNTKEKPQEAHLIGEKAYSLNQFPLGWTPTFFVVTTEAFYRWKQEQTENNNNNLSWLTPFLIPNIKTLSLLFSEVIIRSSVTNESLEDRGLYNSKVCSTSTIEILETLVLLYREYFTEHSKNDNSETKVGIALIVQGHVKPSLFGHLSNERRVARNRNYWLYEIEGGEYVRNPEMDRIAVQIKSKATDKDIDLTCNHSKISLVQALRRVSQYMTFAKSPRFHLEWIFDRKRLWIVQIDEEPIKKGTQPSSEWPILNSIKDHPRPKLNVFCVGTEARGQWKKIRCIQIFRESGLPYAEVFVLEDPNILEALSNDLLPDNLSKDLHWLLLYPVVIRTDIRQLSHNEGFLLTRTETIMTLSKAIDFLQTTTKKFLDEGLTIYDFCFIAHHYIPSRACAFSFTRPGSPIVRIDSSWGIPDGLLYNPHDTFLITADKEGPEIRKRIRCKTDYLDADSNGDWIMKQSGTSLDWGESLREHELIKIFESTRKLALFSKSPVQIMYFIGARPDSGHPDVLPWFICPDTIDEIEADPSQRYGGERIIITNNNDIDLLNNRLQSNAPRSNLRACMKIEPKYLRKPDLVDKMADIAIKYNIPVELEGSILGHTYYLLQKKGVRVLCPDVLIEPELDVQIFGKLVRDRIPELIESHGEKVNVLQLSRQEHLAFLKAKAVEEALEFFWEENTDKAFEELADLYEVIRAACQLYNKTLEQLEEATELKRESRGGFEKGFVLLKTRFPSLLDRHKPDLFNDHSLLEQPDRRSIWVAQHPKIEDSELSIPLIPPTENQNIAHVFSLPGGEHEIKLQYKDKKIKLMIEPIKPFNDDPNQLELELDI